MSTKSKRPENTAFKQQRLKSWQPLLTPKSVIPAFFIIGLVFIPLGLVLKLASDQVTEIILDYSKCASTQDTMYSYDKASRNCTIRFTVPKDMGAPVYLYYRLTNFYQNNRKYVKSFDLAQLQGEAAVKVAAECEPLHNAVGVNVTVEGRVVQSMPGAVYYPCGLIANSLFSDVIDRTLVCVDGDVCKGGLGSVQYAFSGTGIAWPGDSLKYGESKYKTMPNLTQMVIPPPFWMEVFDRFKDGYTISNFPDLSQWEEFQVWMRTAGLPTFRKLHGSNKANFLPAGTWQITVTDNYQTSRFGGTKSIILSTSSILGGKNSFLGGSYILVGSVCVILAVAFLTRHVMKPRVLGDHRLLSWNDGNGAKDGAQ